MLRKGSQVDLLGYGRSMVCNVTDIQAFKRSLPEAIAGENVGVLLKGVKPDFIERYEIYKKVNYKNHLIVGSDDQYEFLVVLSCSQRKQI